MISCRRASELMEDDLEGSLSWSQKSQLRLHTLLCSMCRHYQQQIQRLRKFFRGSAWEEQLPPLSPQARLTISQRIRQELGAGGGGV